MAKGKRAKATGITQRVKQIVFERDNRKCVVCGNMKNVMPNAHYISRNKGGLGIPENIVTLCTRLTETDCHYKYDFGTEKEREYCKQTIERHLRRHYKDWDESNLVFQKGMK